MKRTDPAPKLRLSKAERGELQRQGAKAAARGETVDSNPLGQPLNKPAATGESDSEWLQRSDAWEQGHEAQSDLRRQSELDPPQSSVDEHD